MSVLFYEKVPLEYIKKVFDTMVKCPQHTFQILTKRSKRLREVAAEFPWQPNIWMRVRIEEERVLHRIHDLQTVPAAVRFLSCEPLIRPPDNLPLVGIHPCGKGIHWVIVGRESGPRARPMKAEWVKSIFRQCRAVNLPFFFKQLGRV